MAEENRKPKLETEILYLDIGGTMENDETMDVFCESVDEVSDVGVADITLSGAGDGDRDGERDVPIEDGSVTEVIEINQNFDFPLEEEFSGLKDSQNDENADQSEEDMHDILGETGDATDILQKVLQSSQGSELPMRQIKQELYEGEDNGGEGLDSDNLQSTSDESHSAERQKTAKSQGNSGTAKKVSRGLQPRTRAPKELHITRSGRKSTFTGMAKYASVTEGLSDEEEAVEESPSTEQSECLVCGRQCSPTKSKAIPSFPFCTLCKEAYFSRQQLASDVGEEFVKKKCPKGGHCTINYDNLPKKWCKICHFNRFEAILTELSVEFDFNSKQLKKSKRRPGRKVRTQAAELEETNLMNEALDNSSSVLLQRMSATELANYGIEMEHCVKDELVNFDASHARPRKSPSKRAAEEANSKARKRLKGAKQVHDIGKQSKPKGKKSRKAILAEVPSSDEEDCYYSLPEVNSGRNALETARRSKRLSESVKNNERAPINAGKNYTEVLESIKVYVFTCGHACGLCNSAESKTWLKNSGFHTAKPIFSSSSTVRRSGTSAAGKTPNPVTKQTPSSSHSTNKPKNVDVKTIPSISLLHPTVLRNLLAPKPAGGNVQVVNIVKQNPNTAVRPNVSSAMGVKDAQKCQSSPIIPTLTVSQVLKPIAATTGPTAGQSRSTESPDSLIFSTSHVTSENIPTGQSNSGSSAVQNATRSITVASQAVVNEKPAATVIQNATNTVNVKTSVPLKITSEAKTTASATPNVIKPVQFQAGNAKATTTGSATPQTQSIVKGDNLAQPTGKVQVQLTSMERLLELQKQGYVLTPVTLPPDAVTVNPTNAIVPVSQPTTDDPK